MPTPKVSVIVPNYNHGRYLAKRIETVLGQTFADFELILMDDCSADDSRAVIERYARKDGRIRTVYNQANSGSTFRQWNKGVREARGEYVWLAESDDYADPDLLRTLLDWLDKYPEAVLAYCQSYNINETDHIAGTWKIHTDDLNSEQFSSDFIMSGSDYILDYLIYKNTIPNASAVVFRKKNYELADGADETIKVSSDWRLWIKILQQGQIVYISKPLNYYRTHENTVRAAALKRGADILETLQMVEFIFRTVSLPKTKKAELLADAEKTTKTWMRRDNPTSVSRSISTFLVLWQLDKRLAVRTLREKWIHIGKRQKMNIRKSIIGRSLRKIATKARSKLYPIRRLPIASSVKNFKIYHSLLHQKKGLEIGGPSRIFEHSNILPIYPIVELVDGCNFSTNTIWEGEIQQGHSYKYGQAKKTGYQYVCEASDLNTIRSESYDFILSSHSIEHIANPFKAIKEWLRVLKDKGVIVMVVPHKSGTFDHLRPVTSFAHLVEDFNNDIDEHDLTHLPEILRLHDLSMDPPAGDMETFKNRSLRNFENRCLHHHVFDTPLVIEIFSHFNIHIKAVDLVLPYHIIVLGQKRLKSKADNSAFLKKYEYVNPFEGKHQRIGSAASQPKPN